MKKNILFIENEGLWREHCLLQIHNPEEFENDVFKNEQLSKPLNEIALHIVREWSFIDLFLINVHLQTSEKNRSVCSGIKLLKYIRLNHIDKHCVLYSFLSKEQLMQISPENLIIFSPGVTYLQLPWDFSQIDFFKLVVQKAPGDLSMFLKAESRLPDNRHFFANWWGARQLWAIQQVITPVDDDLKNLLNDQLFSSSKGFDSYQGLLAKYLYSHNTQKLTDRYIEYKREKHNSFQNFSFQFDTSEHINTLDEKIECATKEQNRLSEILHELSANNQWQQFFLKLSGKPKEIQTKIQHFEKGIQEALTEKDRNLRFKELKEYIENEEHKILTEKENLIAERARELEKQQNVSIHIDGDKTVKQIMQKEPPNILYIDDQADEGWAIVFQLMIYGDKKPDMFKSIVPDKSSDINSIIIDCFSSVELFNPDLIILDFRLLGDNESTLNPLELSGAKVLQAFKTGYKKSYSGRYTPVSCPVMIVTASNKIFTYQVVNSLGADACWIKEGLDNRFSLDDSINNYLDFINKVFILCQSKEFRLVRKMKEELCNLKEISSFWWQDKNRFSFKYNDGADIRSIPKNIVIEILENGTLMAETYFHGQLMKSMEFSYENSFPSLIAIKLFQIIETIHNENVEDYTTISKLISEHHKSEAYSKLKKMLELRNDAVHKNSLTFKELESIYDTLIEYIRNKPQKISGFKAVDNNDVEKGSLNISANKKESEIYTGRILKISKKDRYFTIKPDRLPRGLNILGELNCFEIGVINDEGAQVNDFILFEILNDSSGKYYAGNVTYTKPKK